MNIINKIQEKLKNHIDQKTKDSVKKFFKEDVISYGVKIPEVNKITKEFTKDIKTKSKKEVFEICDKLWASNIFEECIIACNLSYSKEKEYEPSDWKIFEYWVNNYVTNWATCDTLCNHTVGTFIEMYPEYIKNLKHWSKSNNRWVKRAAAVTLILPARKGMFLQEIFEIADTLLLDNDDLVQKGYGWMLKAASESNQKEVFDYVMSKKHIMPRTSLRYAIEKMPKELREQAMKKIKY